MVEVIRGDLKFLKDWMEIIMFQAFMTVILRALI